MLIFAAVVVGLDGEDPILLLGNAAAGVGYFDDIVELLADVGGDDQIASSLTLLAMTEGEVASIAFSHLRTVRGLTSNTQAISLMLLPSCFSSSILWARLRFKNLSFPQGSSSRQSGNGQLRHEEESSQPLSSYGNSSGNKPQRSWVSMMVSKLAQLFYKGKEVLSSFALTLVLSHRGRGNGHRARKDGRNV